MSQPATIVFDLDGTLVDTAPDLIDALNRTLELAEVDPIDLDEARAMIGAGVRALLTRGLTARGAVVPDARFEELYAAFLVRYENHIADLSRPFPGLEGALDALEARGAKLAVCTNKVERFAVKLLEELGLRRRFAAIVGGDTFARAKPDPLPLRSAVGRAGGDLSRALLVGDSETDLATARAASIPLVGVSFGYTEVPMAELGPDRLIHHFDDLPAAVDALLAAAPA